MKEDTKLLEEQIEQAQKLVPLGRYRHFKGNLYDVIAVARDSETLKIVVVYRAVHERYAGTWVRPLPLFLERVNPTGILGQDFPRFTRLPEDQQP